MADHGLNPNQILLICHALAPFADAIEQVGLFGSRATGTARLNSDVDLVLYGLRDQRTLDRIHTVFTESLLPFTVDVQAYDLIKYPPLRKHIDDCMQPLFTRQDLLKEKLATQ